MKHWMAGGAETIESERDWRDLWRALNARVLDETEKKNGI